MQEFSEFFGEIGALVPGFFGFDLKAPVAGQRGVLPVS